MMHFNYQVCLDVTWAMLSDVKVGLVNGLVVCLDDDVCHVQRGWPNTQTEMKEAEYQASQWPVTRLQIFLMIKLIPMVIRIKALLKLFTVLSVCVTGRTALVS